MKDYLTSTHTYKVCKESIGSRALACFKFGPLRTRLQEQIGSRKKNRVIRQEDALEIVLVDRFIVPEESKQRFLEQVHKSATFLRTLPGFIEGFVYEKADGEGRHNVMTTAVWKDEESFQNAKRSAAEGFKKIGFNPPEIMKNLKVEIERAVYSRSPY